MNPIITLLIVLVCIETIFVLFLSRVVRRLDHELLAVREELLHILSRLGRLDDPLARPEDRLAELEHNKMLDQK